MKGVAAIVAKIFFVTLFAVQLFPPYIPPTSAILGHTSLIANTKVLCEGRYTYVICLFRVRYDRLSARFFEVTYDDFVLENGLPKTNLRVESGEVFDCSTSPNFNAFRVAKSCKVIIDPMIFARELAIIKEDSSAIGLISSPIVIDEMLDGHARGIAFEGLLYKDGVIRQKRFEAFDNL